jgi:hypothetical protein
LFTHYLFAIQLLFSGQLKAYWKHVFAIVKEHDSSYGTLPNKSMFDEHWEEKRLKAANDPTNPFNPFNNNEHYVWCALENVMYQFCTRGCLEPTSICVDDFVQCVIDKGAFKGIPFIRLKENYGGQKGKSLTIKNSELDADNTWKETFPCPYSTKPLSCYQTDFVTLFIIIFWVVDVIIYRRLHNIGIFLWYRFMYNLQDGVCEMIASSSVAHYMSLYLSIKFS